jgi:hypothetical protein
MAHLTVLFNSPIIVSDPFAVSLFLHIDNVEYGVDIIIALVIATTACFFALRLDSINVRFANIINPALREETKPVACSRAIINLECVIGVIAITVIRGRCNMFSFDDQLISWNNCADDVIGV